MNLPKTDPAFAPRTGAGQAADRAQAAIGWGAAVIDENGNETPITESMISRACDELADNWLFPHSTVPAR